MFIIIILKSLKLPLVKMESFFVNVCFYFDIDGFNSLCTLLFFYKTFLCCSSYTSFFFNLLFVEILKCSCYLNKANVKYLKESLAKHEKLFNTWKFLLFKMTSLGTKFPLYWWTSYRLSIFFVFLLYVLWEMILVGWTFCFLLLLLLKWHWLFYHYNILFDCTLFIWSLTLCILFNFRTC